MKKILLSALIGLVATSAFAHSPLKATTPANEATMAAAPTEITLDFKGKIRLTRVTMTVADKAGVKLDLTGHKGFISDYSIPLNATGSGAYVIEWRGLGADGHALTGSFGFVVE